MKHNKKIYVSFLLCTFLSFSNCCSTAANSALPSHNYNHFSAKSRLSSYCFSRKYVPEASAAPQTSNDTSGNSNQNTSNSTNTAIPSQTDALNLTCSSAVLIEGSSGKVIYEKNKDEQLMPASITKIMTLLLIFDAIDEGKLKLTDTVTVSEHASSMGGSQVYLEPYETQTVDTMIKCISIASANDASVSMAEHIAGSEEAFVKMMNEKASELGMKNTHFLNCCGLDDDITEGHYSSAYDIALMSRALITNHPEISNYSTVWMDSFTHVTKKGESEFGLTNTNKLVRTYDGITGLKTGSTSKAKFCLSATAKRNGMDLIAVVMAAPEPKTRFSEAAKLLDYGFANCTLYEDHNADFTTKELPVRGNIKGIVPVQIKEHFTYPCVNGETSESITKNTIFNEKITAPVNEGDVLGKVIYYYNGKEIGSVPILASSTVPKSTYGDYFKHLWSILFCY